MGLFKMYEPALLATVDVIDAFQVSCSHFNALPFVLAKM
jgi:hypothetical protein